MKLHELYPYRIRNYRSEQQNPYMYGIEIETETLSEDLVSEEIEKYWRITQDGSLRGPSCAELVFKTPYDWEKTKQAIDSLENILKEMPEQSYRTSMHVHISVTDLTLWQIQNIVKTWVLIEEIIEDKMPIVRKYSNYAQPLRQQTLLHHILPSGDHAPKGYSKYLGLNTDTVFTYGSLEFRQARFPKSTKEIYQWLELITNLKYLAESNVEPVEAAVLLLGNKYKTKIKENDVIYWRV